MDLLGLIILVLVLGLVFWLCIWVIDQLPLPHPFGPVAKAIVGLIVILVLLSQTGILSGGDLLHHRI